MNLRTAVGHKSKAIGINYRGIALALHPKQLFSWELFRAFHHNFPLGGCIGGGTQRENRAIGSHLKMRSIEELLAVGVITGGIGAVAGIEPPEERIAAVLLSQRHGQRGINHRQLLIRADIRGNNAPALRRAMAVHQGQG